MHNVQASRAEGMRPGADAGPSGRMGRESMDLEIGGDEMSAGPISVKTVSKRVCKWLVLFLVSGTALAGPYGSFYQAREPARQNGWQRPEAPRDVNRPGYSRNDRPAVP